MFMLFLLLCVAGMKNVVNAQNEKNDPLHQWEMGQPYLFYLLYDDVQARCSSMITGKDAIGHM